MSEQAGSAATETSNPRRPAELYWRELAQLKAEAVCIRLYRNRLARFLRMIEAVKALASSGGVAGWVVWRDIPFLWAGIIAAAQLLDAIKPVFPFARQHRAASELTTALETMFVHAQHQWEMIYTGQLEPMQILEARRQLQLERINAERRSFPDGLDLPAQLVSLARGEAQSYIQVLVGDATERGGSS